MFLHPGESPYYFYTCNIRYTNTSIPVYMMHNRLRRSGGERVESPAARWYQRVRNVRTGRPQPRCMMPGRAMRSRSWPSSADNAIRISKGAPKAGHIIIGVICFAHKKCKTGALGAARSPEKGRTGRPQPRCMMPGRSMRSRSWHPAQKAHSEPARSTKSRPQIIGVICFAHKKCKTGALGAARS